jgi:hypothetical protein
LSAVEKKKIESSLDGMIMSSLGSSSENSKLSNSEFAVFVMHSKKSLELQHLKMRKSIPI